jgi:hypothetical protein
MKQVVKNLEAKVEQLKSLEAKVEQLKVLESTTIEQQAKMTQMEAQLELNVSSILLSLIQSFTVGKTLLLFYDRMN